MAQGHNRAQLSCVCVSTVFCVCVSIVSSVSSVSSVLFVYEDNHNLLTKTEFLSR